MGNHIAVQRFLDEIWTVHSTRKTRHLQVDKKSFIILSTAEMPQYDFNVMKVPPITELTNLSANIRIMINFWLSEIVHSFVIITLLNMSSRDTSRHVCTMYETFDNSAKELVARMIIGTGKFRYISSIFENIRSSMHQKCASCINAQIIFSNTFFYDDRCLFLFLLLTPQCLDVVRKISEFFFTLFLHRISFVLCHKL